MSKVFAKGPRNYTIDIVRMVAAIIVMMGHLLHSTSNPTGLLVGSRFEAIFSSGAFSVVVFFGLSGIALRHQSENFGASFRWLGGRLIRLMPVYWLTLVVPLFGCVLLGVKVDYPIYGFVLASFGLQSLFTSISIPPVNPPLWSLSVEIFLSFFVLFFARIRGKGVLLALTLVIALPLLTTQHPILVAIPVFYIGYLLPQLNFDALFTIRFGLFCGVITGVLLVVFPVWVQDLQKSKSGYLIRTLLALGILLFCLTKSSIKQSIYSKVSQRSYSLYAAHSLVMLVLRRIFLHLGAPFQQYEFISTLFAILIGTELLYRFVDLPSIHASRRFLQRKQLTGNL